jgi:hypothetical protein
MKENNHSDNGSKNCQAVHSIGRDFLILRKENSHEWKEREREN